MPSFVLVLMVVSLAEALCDRLLDYEENVRKQVVAAICDVACHSLGAVPVETIKQVAERVRDKSVSSVCPLLHLSIFMFDEYNLYDSLECMVYNCFFKKIRFL